MHPKNEEKAREALSIKEAQKEIKKTERANKKIQEGIPDGVPKIGELYSTVDKDEKIAAENTRENKIHIDYQTNKKAERKPQDNKTQEELSKGKAQKK